MIGSWIVGETPAGIDVRETGGPITGDLAEFVPHFIDEPAFGHPEHGRPQDERPRDARGDRPQDEEIR